MRSNAPISLQDKIDQHGDLWSMLYDAAGKRFTFPIQAEFSNWVDEQQAWRESAIFQNMSHHMTEGHIEGPDVVRLLSDLGINSFANFGPMQAKQYVACNYDGQFIGDAILFCEEENKVSIVGKPMLTNWIKFHIETGDYDAQVTQVDRPSPNLSDRVRYRFQVQGPNADKILEELNGGPLPEIGFFKMGRFNIGPFTTTALNHRMSGAPGYEFWGPSSEGDAVRELVLEAGTKYELSQIGGRIYPVTACVSGWIGSVLPAIYTGEKMRSYREWLPATGFEAMHSIGGSLASGNVADYYRTPYDLGYGFMIKFDHDFIGREALEAMQSSDKMKKVRLMWNAEDAVDIFASQFGDRERHKKLELPTGGYATSPSDLVQLQGQNVGVSFYPVYSEADRSCISLGAIRSDLAVEGQELNLIWGEPNGGSNKPAVERHSQKTVRVVVDPQPIKRD